MPETTNNKDKQKFTKLYKDVGPYMGLGTQLAVTMVLMFFVGKWLDGELNTFPWLTITFSFLGGFAGIYNFIKEVLKINEEKKKN